MVHVPDRPDVHVGLSSLKFRLRHDSLLFSEHCFLDNAESDTRPPTTQTGLRSAQVLHGAHDANRTRDLVLTKDVLCQLSYVGSSNHILSASTHGHTSQSLDWSGRWDLNPRQPAWKAGTLPLSYARPRNIYQHFTARDHNPLRPAILPRMTHSTRTEPYAGGQARIRTLEAISQQIYSLPPLATWVPARSNSPAYSPYKTQIKFSELSRHIHTEKLE